MRYLFLGLLFSFFLPVTSLKAEDLLEVVEEEADTNPLYLKNTDSLDGNFQKDLKDLVILVDQLQKRLSKLEARVYQKEISEKPEEIKTKTLEQAVVVKEEKKSLTDTLPEDKKARYDLGKKAMLDGDAEKAKSIFLSLSDCSGHSYKPECFYWLGVIALVEEKNPQKASKLFSKAYQLSEKASQKPSLFKQSILVKLAEALLSCGEKKKAQIMLSKFFKFQEDIEASKLSDADQKKKNALLKQAKKMQSQF